MQVPLLSGVVGSSEGEFRLSYPRNLEPVVIDSKISKGQLRAAAGATSFATGPGADRGGILWNDQCFRVMGSKLVLVKADASVTIIGDVGDDGKAVRLDYGFDRLAIASDENLFYYDGTALNQVTDADLGKVLDALWMNGFYITTDGTYVVVTELSDPYQVLPLKYGSAEQDPDSVTGLMRVRGELYVMGLYTIEVHQLVGGSGFPFQAVPGATIPFGCVGASAKAYFAESFAFVGGARDAAIGVYVAGSGTATKISSRTVDDALAAVADPTSIELETRSYRDEERLFVHLPDRSFVFMRQASEISGDKIWYEAGSGIDGPYRPVNAVNAYGKTIVGDRTSSALGLLTEGVSDHFGEVAQWGFDVGLLYNGGKGGIVNQVELSGLFGRAPFGDETTVFLSFSRDGEAWSAEKARTLGQAGDHSRSVRWWPGRQFSGWLGMRFRGYGRALPGIAACEVEAEALSA